MSFVRLRGLSVPWPGLVVVVTAAFRMRPYRLQGIGAAFQIAGSSLWDQSGVGLKAISIAFSFLPATAAPTYGLDKLEYFFVK